jgi:hypothetical protein
MQSEGEMQVVGTVGGLLILGFVDTGAFWKTLVEASTVQSIMPRQRWDVDAFYDPDGGSGKMYTRIAATIQVNYPLFFPHHISSNAPYLRERTISLDIAPRQWTLLIPSVKMLTTAHAPVL